MRSRGQGLSENGSRWPKRASVLMREFTRPRTKGVAQPLLRFRRSQEVSS
jgi:hypothetical protein